jgi:hypothetical protein
VFRIRRTAGGAEGWGRIETWSIAPDGTVTLLDGPLGSERFTWVGPTPPMLRASPEELERADGPL